MGLKRVIAVVEVIAVEEKRRSGRKDERHESEGSSNTKHTEQYGMY
jgi:hypothetical protein